MTYSFDLILKKDGRNSWLLVTEKGVTFYEFKAHSVPEAIDKARQYTSSWSSVRIRMEGEDVTS